MYGVKQKRWAVRPFIEIRRLLLLTMLLALCFGGVSAYAGKLYYDGAWHTYSAQPISLSVEGKRLTDMDVPPVILQDRTFVPLRVISEALGADVAWNNETREVFVTYNSNIVVMKIDQKKATKNGTSFTLEQAPKIINDRTMVPLRGVSEALGCHVGWDNSTRLVSVTTTEPETPKDTETPSTPSKPTQGSIAVTKVAVPTASDAAQVFQIIADGMISSWNEVKLDDTRIILDISGAKSKIAQSSLPVSTSPYVTCVRSAEREEDGITITRVVLDLGAKAEYSVQKSNDSKSLFVSFSKNKLQSIHFGKEGDMDRVSIVGDLPVTADISTMTNPHRIVIDIPNAVSSLPETPSFKGADHIQAVRTSQYGENSVRVVIELSAAAEHVVSKNGNTLTLDLYVSNIENITYQSNTQVFTLTKPSGAFAAKDMIHEDLYRAGTYRLILPGDYSSHYGQGTYRVQDSALDKVTIKTENGKTTLTFAQKKILAYTVTEDAAAYYIKLQSPREVYDKILLLDAGHGGKDPGTQGNGLQEKYLALSIADKVAAYLEDYPQIKVYRTRVDDTYPENTARANMANEVADVFVSIHLNSAFPNETPNGSETLYKPQTGSTSLTNLKLATVLHNKLIAALGTTDRGLKPRTDLLILNVSKKPTVILEIAFLSNSNDAQMISDTANQSIAARAIGEGIVQVMEEYSFR